ncbi:MAG: exosortase-associated EpsI family protein [Planctomycetota bacterium]
MKTPHLIRMASPAVAAALLIALIASTGGIAGARTPGSAVYFERVKDAIEAVPYIIDGRWVGQDEDPQEAATTLLKPNKLMQRRYRDQETGQVVTLLIVHCKDVRDMVGHYPLNCYPNAGWELTGQERESNAVGALSVSSTAYGFRREHEGLRHEMRVQNFFILPAGDETAGRVAADYDELDRAGRSARWTELGAAQVQILTDPLMDAEFRDEATRAFMAALEPVIDQIASGVQPGDAEAEREGGGA